MEQKKKRGENWGTEEKKMLRQLIAQSAHIIEDKSTKTSVNNLKTKEWKNIKNKLNKSTGKSRSDVEIKLAWKRMKMTDKSDLAHRREQLKTVGGEKPPSPSPEDLAVKETAPHDFIIEIKVKTSKTTQEPKASTEITDLVIVNNEENAESHFKSEQAENIEISEITQIETTNKSGPSIERQENAENRSQEKCNLESNVEFKKRQLEMMEVEHRYKINISELKIKKLELEIALLENNNSG